MSVTTEDLLSLAKEAADLTNVEDYVTDDTWVSWLNAGALELHRKVTKKFKATYFRTWDFTLTADQSEFALPSNFWRLKGLDLDPDTVRRREVRPYNFAERNRYRFEVMRTVDPAMFCTDRYYNLVGSSLLRVQPQESAAGNYRLYYTPKPKTLALARSITRDTVNDAVAAGADGFAVWTFTNFGLAYPVTLSPKLAIVNVGDLLTIAGAATANNAAREIISVESATSVRTYGAFTPETLGAGPTATLATCLDPELEPFAEYVWLSAAMKSLNKEESFAQIRLLMDQRKLIDDDLAESLETDQGGPATIIDTDEDWL